MKYVLIISLGLISLTGCGGDGGGSASAPQAIQNVAPTSFPTVSPTASPSPAPAWGGFSGGGDLANPYQVTTSEDVDHIRDFPAAYFELTGNIDMTGVAFTPITNFSGVIQGNFYKLENLTIQTAGGDPAAFAVTLSGIINRLYLKDILIESTGDYAAALAFNLSGTISNSQILSGTINSHLGGNGNGVGVGNPFAVNRVGGSVMTGRSSDCGFQ